jgi:hypothetical protein
MKIITALGAIIFSLAVSADEAKKVPSAPTIDGYANEVFWQQGEWIEMTEAMLGETPSADDFTGRYKLGWDANALYLLAEIHDEHISDTYPDPLERYWDDDCLEIFIDADKSGGDHFNNYNAFAYHVALDNQVVDIGPNEAGEPEAQLYNDHVTSAWKRQKDAPHAIYWEVAIRIFADDYQHGKDNVPITLKEDMALGFMLAYCDADGADREHFMGSHPITPVNGDKNLGYKDASVFDVLRLKGSD